MLARARCFWNLDAIAAIDQALDRNDSVRSLGHRRASRDARSSPWRKRTRRRLAGRDPVRDRKLPRGLPGPKSKSVHRRARERGKIDPRERRLT